LWLILFTINNRSFPFLECRRIINIAGDAGFPSNDIGMNPDYEPVNRGSGVVPYPVDRIDTKEKKRFVLLAHMRFENAVHAHDGTEEEKVAAAIEDLTTKTTTVPVCFSCKASPNNLLTCSGCKNRHFCDKACQAGGWKLHRKECKQLRKGKFKVGEFLSMAMRGGGANGVLGTILSYV